MKTAAVLLLLLLLLTATPVYAFDPPVQGTDNATDVINWHGDTANVSITSANVTFSELDDTIDNVADNYLAFFTVVFVLIIVLMRGGNILYAIGTGVAWVYGFYSAANQTVMSPLWIADAAIGVMGIYFLYLIARDAIGRSRE